MYVTLSRNWTLLRNAVHTKITNVIYHTCDSFKTWYMLEWYKTILLCMMYVHLVGLIKENKLIKMNGVSKFQINTKEW